MHSTETSNFDISKGLRISFDTSLRILCLEIGLNTCLIKWLNSHSIFILYHILLDRNTPRIEHFMIIRHILLDRFHFSIFVTTKVSKVKMGCSTFHPKSKSMQSRKISTTSFQTLKFVPFKIGIEFNWEVTFAS